MSGGGDLFAARPVEGYGSGVVRARVPAPRGRRLSSDAATASHTIPVTVAAEQGVIGLIAYVALLVAALGAPAARRGLLDRSLGVAAAFLALLFHTLVYAAFLEDPMTWALLGVGTALAVAAAPRARAGRRARRARADRGRALGGAALGAAARYDVAGPRPWLDEDYISVTVILDVLFSTVTGPESVSIRPLPGHVLNISRDRLATLSAPVAVSRLTEKPTGSAGSHGNRHVNAGSLVRIENPRIKKLMPVMLGSVPVNASY